MIITFKQPENKATKILNMEETTMKKFTKTIAAISAAAMLTISSGMTASAYYVTKVNPNKLTNNGTKTTGFKWDTNELQDKLPVFSKTLLDKKANLYSRYL